MTAITFLSILALILAIRQSQRSNQRLADMIRERDEAIAAHQKIYHDGWSDCDRTWRAKPIYLEGYHAACHDLAAETCEMEETRKSGELQSTL